MGLTAFNELVKSKNPNIFKIVNLAEIAAKQPIGVAIDTHYVVYSNESVSCKIHVEAMSNEEVLNGEPDRFLILQDTLGRILHVAEKFLVIGITPVFVIDGDAHPKKEETRKNRREVKKNYRAKLEKLRNDAKGMDPAFLSKACIDDMKKCLRYMMGIHQDDFQTIHSFLHNLGFPVIKAKYDGEKTCAALVRAGICWAVYSKDVDVYAFGGNRLITNIDPPIESQIGLICMANVVETTDVLNALQLTPEQLIDLFILVGSDYNVGLHGIGCKKAYDLLKSAPTGRIETCKIDFAKIRTRTVNSDQIDPLTDKPIKVKESFQYKPSDLDQIAVREIFAEEPLENVIMTYDYRFNFDKKVYREFGQYNLAMYQYGKDFGKFLLLIENIEEIKLISNPKPQMTSTTFNLGIVQQQFTTFNLGITNNNNNNNQITIFKL